MDDAPPDSNELPDERERWIREREQRTLVERRFRGLLTCLHWAFLVLVLLSVAWYVGAFGAWKDLARLGVLGGLIALLLSGWLITVHGEVAAWKVGRKDNRFRTICARRIAPQTKNDEQSMNRLPTEGYFDADLPGAASVALAVGAGVAIGASLLRGRPMPEWLDLKTVSTTLVWIAVGGAGALGYTRTRLHRVKRLLSGASEPLDFGNYFGPTEPRPLTPREARGPESTPPRE